MASHRGSRNSLSHTALNPVHSHLLMGRPHSVRAWSSHHEPHPLRCRHVTAILSSIAREPDCAGGVCGVSKTRYSPVFEVSKDSAWSNTPCNTRGGQSPLRCPHFVCWSLSRGEAIPHPCCQRQRPKNSGALPPSSRPSALGCHCGEPLPSRSARSSSWFSSRDTSSRLLANTLDCQTPGAAGSAAKGDPSVAFLPFHGPHTEPRPGA